MLLPKDISSSALAKPLALALSFALAFSLALRGRGIIIFILTLTAQAHFQEEDMPKIPNLSHFGTVEPSDS